ncbi:MAG: DUF5723 family protein [Bacteroidetes bacterium]|nr:DUF5723 family protein [Bacteroidota bacterium]MCL2303182.1 DUF5723 family protein [Lentimicrobiaceae bacterium]
MKKCIFLFLIGLFFVLNTYSQSVGITDFMRLNPYSNFNNPAYFVPYNGYVGIPAISNINFSLYNSGLHYKNLFESRSKMTTTKFINSLAKNNWFNTELNMELLGFGFRVKDYFFSFSYRLRVEQHFRYPRDLFGFLLEGNLTHSNAEFEIEPNLNIYQEMSIGFQGEIFDRLYVGARPKILFGLINVNTDEFRVKVNTNPNDYTISGIHNINMKVASIMPFYKRDAVTGNIALNTEYMFDMGNNVGNVFSKNMGFAIDLGAVYRVNQQIRVSASVTDLGFIRWAGSTLEIASNPHANRFEFQGFTADQITNFIQNGIDFTLDTIFNIANNTLDLNSLGAYTTMLTSKVMVDGYFDLTPSNRFILQCKGYIIGKYFLPQLTVAYNGTFFNAIDVVVSYSVMKKSFANVGIGVGFRIGPVHLYAGTDNVLAAINVLNAARANGTFGLLVNFPTRPKVKEAELKSLFRAREEATEQTQEIEASE